MSPSFHAQAQQIRECRSLVLDYVNSVYPETIAEDLVAQVMGELPEPLAPEFVRRDLGYLRDRGLIEPELRENPVTRRKERRWRLTAAGVTFIERGKPWSDLEGC